MILRTAFSLLVGLVFMSASVYADDAKDASKKLQGTWQLTKGVRSGKAMPAEKVEKTQLEFKDDMIIVHDGSSEPSVSFTIDPTKNPAQIDVKPPNEVKPVAGIYKLDGDTLTICFSRDGEDRPTEFESKEGANVTLFVLKREKK